MTTKYLDSSGLAYFWSKVKALIPTKTSDITNDSGFITNPNIPYCTCVTAAGTKAKTTTIVSGTFTADDLVTGAQVLVKFTNANTVADPTLKIGSTTAKTIKRYGTTAPSTSAASSWNAGAVMMFTYDGTYWQMVDWVNTTYTSMTVAEIEAGTGTTARSITPARLKTAILTWALPATFTESDPVFSASAAAGISSSDISNWDGKQAALVSGTNIKTVNSESLLGSGNISVGGGLSPLIGDTDDITPTQVKTALREGRDICIAHTGTLEGMNLDLRFTSWNGATDLPYSGAYVDIVASQTIAQYYGHYYLFELVGSSNGVWDLFTTLLAKESDIPSNVSSLTNDAGYMDASDVLDMFYPVGSYYETSDSTFDPNASWGGTWSLEASGLVHVSAGTGYTIGDTGGEATHVLTSDEMPSHEGHLYSNTGSVTGAGNAAGKYLQTMATYGTSPRGWRDVGSEYYPIGYSRGSGSAHNNMQPYVVVNRWHRTA